MTLDRGAFYKEKSIWNRQAYMGLFREKKITAVVRIGDRSGPRPQESHPARQATADTLHRQAMGLSAGGVRQTRRFVAGRRHHVRKDGVPR